jgi:glycosyltransferase involved in cell wall biosynthesis
MSSSLAKALKLPSHFYPFFKPVFCEIIMEFGQPVGRITVYCMSENLQSMTCSDSAPQDAKAPASASAPGANSNAAHLNFSIVTPSFRNSKWLKLCIASVADQKGVAFEHIVQDSCSDDGTQDWLPKDSRVKAFIEKDKGMYDAVNRGWKRAQGEIIAYLNCDEQYLPGALKSVHDFFQSHPEVDVVFSDTVIVDENGGYFCHRPSLVPLKHQTWIRFSVLTCSVFIRRRVVEKLGLYFDTKWRDLGDAFWLLELINRGVRMAVLPKFTSAFTETGENMNLKPNAIREKAEKVKMTPAWIKRLSKLFILRHRWQMFARGSYFQRPFDYSIYTLGSPAQRVAHHVAKPTARWRGRS